MAAGWLEQKQSVLPSEKDEWGPEDTGIQGPLWWKVGDVRQANWKDLFDVCI